MSDSSSSSTTDDGGSTTSIMGQGEQMWNNTNNSFSGAMDPLKFSAALFAALVLFVLYLLLPRGVRKQYFGAYPKRHAWSARSRRSQQQQQQRGGGGQVRCIVPLLPCCGVARYSYSSNRSNESSYISFVLI